MAYRLLILLLALPALAVDRYVDNALVGNSANDGLAWTSAWTNFTSINWNGLATGSNTIYFSGGASGKTYSERLFVKHTSFADGNRITLRCGQDAGHTGALSFTSGIQMGDELANRANNVTIDGSLNGAVNWSLTTTFVKSTIHHRYGNESGNIYRYLNITTSTNDDAQTHGIQLSSYTTNTLIEYCVIHDCERRGIREASGDSFYGRLTVRYCTFFGNREDDIVASGGVDFHNNNCDGRGSVALLHPDGIQGVSGAWRIYNNVFHDHTQEIFIETTDTNLTDVLIYNNRFYDLSEASDSPAIILRAKTPTDSYHGWSNIVIANNVFHQMDASAVRFLADPTVNLILTASLLANNIWAENNSANMIISDGAGGEGYVTWAVGGFNYVANVFWNPESSKYQGSSYATVSELQSAHADCVLNLAVNPQFYSPGAQDYRLTAGSPCIDAATNLSSYFTTDASGEARGTTWDIGAFEFRPIITHNIGTLRIGTLRNL